VDPALYGEIFAIEEHYWWSVGTRAIFRDWLERARVRGGRILDVGCGSGILARELETLGEVVAIDVSQEAVGYTRRRGLPHLCVARAEALPFAPGSFDAVVAADVIEHTDDARTIAELVRVLKPGGVALIHVPAFSALWGEHDEVAHHRRRYRRGPLVRLANGAGLRVERVSYINLLLFPVAAAVRLGKRVLRAVRQPGVPAAEIYRLPGWVNRGLTGLLLAERALLRRINFPFGVSLLCLARKHDATA
jgi:SAM-dependent methyltransferase